LVVSDGGSELETREKVVDKGGKVVKFGFPTHFPLNKITLVFGNVYSTDEEKAVPKRLDLFSILAHLQNILRILNSQGIFSGFRWESPPHMHI